MQSNWISRTSLSLVWPIALLGAGGLWFGLAQGDGVAVLLGAAGLALTMVLGTICFYRVGAARRFNAAMNAYAEREIDRQRLATQGEE